MSREVIEKYQDVLQNIEFSIVEVYKDNPTLLDYSVMQSLEAMIEHYVAIFRGRAPRKIPLTPVELQIFESMKSMCNWRLGYPGPSDMPEIEPIQIDEIILCLKQILHSVQKWNKEYGRQGYLQFVSQFMG